VTKFEEWRASRNFGLSGVLDDFNALERKFELRGWTAALDVAAKILRGRPIDGTIASELVMHLKDETKVEKHGQRISLQEACDLARKTHEDVERRRESALADQQESRPMYDEMKPCAAVQAHLAEARRAATSAGQYKIAGEIGNIRDGVCLRLSHGLTKRDIFAALAMAGYNANREIIPCGFLSVDKATWCLSDADALVAALEKPQ